MQLRFPWILSRRRLITSVAADGVLFAFLYHTLYKWYFAVWPSISFRLAVLLTIWTLGSYVIGRYASAVRGGSLQNICNFVGKQLVGTGFVLFLTLGITLLHVWIFNQAPAQASLQSFLIPFLGLLSVLSPLVQFSLSSIMSLRDLRQNSVWSYIGSDSGFQQLQDMLTWTRVQVSLEHVLPHQINQNSTSQYIVDHFHEQSSAVLEKLYRCQKKGSVVLSRLAWCELVLQRFPSELLSEGDLLEGCFSIPRGTLQSRLKRLGDVVVALALLIFSIPLMLVSAILIKLSDRGPVFYSQVRIGLNGNPYRIWKLRTMRTDAERQGAQWSSRSDPRITRIGSLLRLTRLDELPQLGCVLTGSMSLIGPRPERPEFDQYLSQKIPYYELRHLIRPGLSGWAQVNYPYGASVEDSANKLSYDLFYLKNFSFFLDLLILFKTMRLVFNAQGALPQPSTQSKSLLDL